MNLTLTDEQREIRDWVRAVVRKELPLLEPEVLKRERAHEPAFAPGEYASLGDLGGTGGRACRRGPRRWGQAAWCGVAEGVVAGAGGGLPSPGGVRVTW
jgi:alkylation response protein AidB-like acyl-CoA dehydrogenase